MAYTLTGEKCGTVRFDAETTGVITAESMQGSSKVTSNPMEQGADINDHVVNDPDKYTLTGVLIGGDEQKETLLRMRKEKDVLSYIGRIKIDSCVITSLKFDVSAKIKDGYSVTLQLQVINRTASDYVESGQQLMSAQNAQAPVSVSTSQTKATSADGLHTVATEKISSSAYAEYVDSFSSKASSSSDPAQRSTSAYSGA